jgi:hypothetical protein
MSELDLSEDDVREEHLAAVHQSAQWLYLFGVLGAGLALMIVLIALLDAGQA